MEDEFEGEAKRQKVREVEGEEEGTSSNTLLAVHVRSAARQLSGPDKVTEEGTSSNTLLAVHVRLAARQLSGPDKVTEDELYTWISTCIPSGIHLREAYSAYTYS